MSLDFMLNSLKLTSGTNNDLYCSNCNQLTLCSNCVGSTSTSGTPASATSPSSAEAGTSTSCTPAQGPILEEEIRAVLLQKAPVTTTDLVCAFKARLKTQEDKRAFADILKRISKIQKSDSMNCTVLRELGN